MKNLITIINLSIIIVITTIFTQSDKLKTNDNKVVKSQKQTSEAGRTNTVTSDFVSVELPTKEKSKADEVVINFLQEIAEVRLMDLEEGKTAQQRATTKALKDYGSLIAKDQAEMLENLRKIAERKKVSIPSWVGPEKAEALSELKELHGKFFDRKFIKMMMIDHKRDIKKLENAIHYGDADVQVFATRYLPVVQSHLDKIKALKKSH